jgi:hypothetical protein
VCIKPGLGLACFVAADRMRVPCLWVRIFCALRRMLCVMVLNELCMPSRLERSVSRARTLRFVADLLRDRQATTVIGITHKR